MFFGMVMVASAFATILAYIINKSSLAQNNVFIVIVIICTYWIVTLLNLKAKFDKLLNSFSSVKGIYVPFTLLVLLGLWLLFK